VSEIADQVCDGVLFNGSAAPPKNRERLRGRGNVFGFIDHAFLDYTARAASNRSATTQKRARPLLDRATHAPERFDGEPPAPPHAIGPTEKMLDEQKQIERFSLAEM
jgi:hypothetical protein